MESKYIIGIDLGGTKISGALANFNGDIVAKYILPTKVEEGEEAVLERIISIGERVLGKSKVNKEDVLAIGRAANEAIKNGEHYEKVTSFEVFKEAGKGDQLSQKVLNKALNYLGICVANVITSFDPEVVIIGGGVSKGGQIVFDKINEVVKARCNEKKVIVICNLSALESVYYHRDIKLSYDNLLLCNYDVHDHDYITSFVLKPYEARVYRIL